MSSRIVWWTFCQLRLFGSLTLTRTHFTRGIKPQHPISLLALSCVRFWDARWSLDSIQSSILLPSTFIYPRKISSKNIKVSDDNHDRISQKDNFFQFCVVVSLHRRLKKQKDDVEWESEWLSRAAVVSRWWSGGIRTSPKESSTLARIASLIPR